MHLPVISLSDFEPELPSAAKGLQRELDRAASSWKIVINDGAPVGNDTVPGSKLLFTLGDQAGQEKTMVLYTGPDGSLQLDDRNLFHLAQGLRTLDHFSRLLGITRQGKTPSPADALLVELDSYCYAFAVTRRDTADYAEAVQRLPPLLRLARAILDDISPYQLSTERFGTEFMKSLNGRVKGVLTPGSEEQRRYAYERVHKSTGSFGRLIDRLEKKLFTYLSTCSVVPLGRASQEVTAAASVPPPSDPARRAFCGSHGIADFTLFRTTPPPGTTP